MVKQTSGHSLDRVFAALADPTRRALLARLAAAETLPVGVLAAPLPISLPAVSKHLDVLEAAGLLVRERQGRQILCRLRPEPLREAVGWLAAQERFWGESLDRLAALVERPQ